MSSADSAEWLDPETVETYWPGARDEVVQYEDGEPQDGTLSALLVIARDQCVEFMPDGAPVTERHLMAQAMQARAVWRSVKAGGADGIGADGMTVTVFPMDWTVKALLRPKTGRPRVGRGKRAIA